jgi:hypothetical protein
MNQFVQFHITTWNVLTSNSESELIELKLVNKAWAGTDNRENDQEQKRNRSPVEHGAIHARWRQRRDRRVGSLYWRLRSSYSRALLVDLASLSTQQLSQVKKQLDDELEHLTNSFSQLRAAQAKFRECLKSIAGGVNSKVDSELPLWLCVQSLTVLE